MHAYIARRLLHLIVVLVGVSVVTFLLVRLSGDPAALLLPESATPAQIEEMRQTLGLSDPLPVQFARFLSSAARGDFGLSLRHKEPALGLVLERLPATIELTLSAMALSLAVAIPLGIAAALRPGSFADRLVLFGSVLAQSMPIFWTGALLIIIFGVNLRWLPVSGRSGPVSDVLPAISLALYFGGVVARVLRSSVVEALGEGYIQVARAKGLRERLVVRRHALRNAAIPTLTIVGLQFGVLLGGVIITERVFAYPGMGLLALQAISNRDYAVLQAFVAVVAVIVACINLIVDLAYAAIDPRIRYA